MTPNIIRTTTSQQETLVVYGGARTSAWLLPPEGRSVLEVQVIKNAADWKDVPVEKNYCIPPYHWHWYQEEYFDVKKGQVVCGLAVVEIMRWLLKINDGMEMLLGV